MGRPHWSGVHQPAPEFSEALPGSIDHILLLTDTFVCEGAMCAPNHLRFMINLFRFYRGDVIGFFRLLTNALAEPCGSFRK
jgi:hypothetical protein